MFKVKIVDIKRLKVFFSNSPRYTTSNVKIKIIKYAHLKNVPMDQKQKIPVAQA